MLAKNSGKGRNQRGLTLIELLISVTIFLVGVGAIYSVTRLATIQKNTVSTRTDQLRSARIALEYIRRDALNAGFGFHRTGGNIPDNAGNGLFGIPSDSDTERDFLTSIICGNETNNNSLTPSGKTDVVVFASRDAGFNNGNLINYTSSVGVGTAVNVTTAANACANCNKYDLYLLESDSGTTQVLGMVTTKMTNSSIQFAPGTDDPFNINQSASASGHAQNLLAVTAGGGTLKRINLISYSVTNNGVLVRKKYGNQTGSSATAQLETRELVYNVSNFQIKYYMEDGTTVDDPSSNNNGRTNQIKMNNIVQIEVTITLAPSANESQPMVTTPIVLKEYISTKNLRYEAS